MEPGLYPDLPFEDYRKALGLSSTLLKAFRANPAGSRLPVEPTEDMLIGQAVHAYSLEGPTAFFRQFVVMFDSPLNKNSSAYKEQRAAWEADLNGQTVLPSHHRKVPTLDVIRGVDAALKAHPMASLILDAGHRELSAFWDDPMTGARCKARFDHVPDNRCLVDLKKTASVDRFRNQIVDLSYDVQAGHYANGAEANEVEVDTFLFVAVETTPPYAVRCCYLDCEWLEWARREARRLIRLVLDCRKRETFPAYALPPHLQSLDDLNPHDLLDELSMPPWR